MQKRYSPNRQTDTQIGTQTDGQTACYLPAYAGGQNAMLYIIDSETFT